MLVNYQQQTRRLLDDQQFLKFNDFDLLEYINQARRQVSLDLEVLRQPADLNTVEGVSAYSFASATAVTSPTTVAGLDKIVLIRSAALSILTGYQRIEIRPWEWFESYKLDRIDNPEGQPQTLAQQLLGAGVGTLWLSPTPDGIYRIRLYPVWTPLDLVDDSTAEALPQPWQDVIPYYAAYLAYLTAKDVEAAQNMWGIYQIFQNRSIQQVTGTRLPQNFPVFREMSNNPTGNKNG